MNTDAIGKSRDILASAKLAICGAARDCRDALAKNLALAGELGSICSEYAVIVVENDSTDGTKELLREKSAADSSLHIAELEDLVTPPNEKPFDRSRIQRIADCRNACLEQVDALQWEPDFLVVWDWDLKRIDLDGIVDSFGRADEWDAVTANGKTIHGLARFWKGYKYADCYAYRAYGWPGPQSLDQIDQCRKTLSELQPGMPMIRVASAFGGLALYKFEAIRGLRYRVEDNDDPEVSVLCEHDTFHRDMADRGADRIFINPSMIVYYDTYLNRLKRLI